MKSFLKTTLAVIVGFIIASFVSMFIIFGIIGSLVGSGDSIPDVAENSILEIKLDNTIADRASSNPLGGFDFMTMTPKENIGLNDILENIEKAKTDDKIKGIYLNLTDVVANFGGFATLEEIRNKLIDFKKSEKFIVAYGAYGLEQRSYYLATIADNIYINPETTLMWSGMGGQMVFYKDALKKLGIEPQIIRHGKYKAAVEPFMLDKMSKENREQTMKYVGGLWNILLEGVSAQRNISVERLNEIADNFKIYSPDELKELGFIDGAVYEDEMIDILREMTNVEKGKGINKIALKEYIKVPKNVKGLIKDKIAVIYATGEIGMTQSADKIGPELAETIREVREQKSVKAVVLRVNSPGGSALTSDIIWREVCLLQKEKPVIVSMGNVAASGGYYISCAADTIVASPNTITGSIGIFGLFFSGEELIKNKLGLKTEEFGTNKHTNFGGRSPLPIPLTDRALTPYERNVMQTYIEKGYRTFVSKVSEGRNMSFEEIDKIGQGRVWTGEDAKKIGLVDVLGGMETAIRIAKEKANLDKYAIVNFPKEKDQIQELIESLTTQVKMKIAGSDIKFYQQIKDIIDSEGIQARIPYNLELK